MLHHRLRAAAGNRGGIPTDGLIAHYTMDDADVSGSTLADVYGTNDATLVGTASATGIIGESRSLDGADDRIDTPITLPLSGDWTVVTSVYIVSLPTSEENIFSQYIGGDDGRYLIRVSPTGKSGQADIFFGGSTSPGVSLAAGWNFIVVKRSGDTHSMKVDDATTVTLSKSGSLSNEPVTLGALLNAGSWQSHITARYDRTLIYSRALTASEETELYGDVV